MPEPLAGMTRLWRERKSLGAKLVLILTAVGVAGSVAIMLLLGAIITPSFNALEASSVAKHVERTQAALAEYRSKVENAVRDYGDWNDSYDYMEKPSRAFEEDSFSELAMANLGIDAMAYVHDDGRIQIIRWIDIATQKDVPAQRAAFERMIHATDLARALHGKSASSFYARFGDTLAVVAIAQIRRTDQSGTPRGHVLMVRSLSAKTLSGLLAVDARLSLARPARDVQVVEQSSRLAIGVPIRGAGGAPVATVAFQVPRDFTLLGRRMLLFAGLGTIVLLFVVLVVLRRAIARLVLRPLNRVERHMGVVRQSGGLGLLTEEPRRDEIGSLVTSFNSMLRQLKELREQLEVQSFALGRSESAVAVMHNVRNALNPVSTVLSQGLNAAPSADRAMVDRALSELASADIPEVRRQKLAAFLAAALTAVDGEREDRRRQFEIGREALRHVLEIIGQQQEVAHERPPLDTCDLADIIAQNATIARYSGEQAVRFDFDPAPCWVLANRVILSQVVGNLFSNAVEAIVAAGQGSGTIAVSSRADGDTVELTIRDDGEGFDPANAPRLFQRGFSTRQHKSGGLGLHWCANSMLAMEGRLELHSDGKGHGARAVLTLKAAAGMGAEELAA